MNTNTMYIPSIDYECVQYDVLPYIEDGSEKIEPSEAQETMKGCTKTYTLYLSIYILTRNNFR